MARRIPTHFKKTVGHPGSTVARVVNAANHTQRMKMGVDYRLRRTSEAVLGHVRAAGPTSVHVKPKKGQ